MPDDGKKKACEKCEKNIEEGDSLKNRKSDVG
jgi:hypothetical protein